jgi:hypothetical protein
MTCLQTFTTRRAIMEFHKAPSVARHITSPRGLFMNTIIYIVGLVVIIGVILSYFGFR